MKITIMYSQRQSTDYPCEASTVVNGHMVEAIGTTYDDAKVSLIKKVQKFLHTDYFENAPDMETVEVKIEE